MQKKERYPNREYGNNNNALHPYFTNANHNSNDSNINDNMKLENENDDDDE